MTAADYYAGDVERRMVDAHRRRALVDAYPENLAAPRPPRTLDEISSALTLLNVRHEVTGLGGSAVGIVVPTSEGDEIMVTLDDGQRGGEAYEIGSAEQIDTWTGSSWGEVTALAIAHSVRGFAEVFGLTTKAAR